MIFISNNNKITQENTNPHFNMCMMCDLGIRNGPCTTKTQFLLHNIIIFWICICENVSDFTGCFYEYLLSCEPKQKFKSKWFYTDWHKLAFQTKLI